ncbi:peptidoglycan-binding protein [Alteromonas aestuariivivens]|uniref:Peptidoglycan-binding protein n=1 Tax=Alteromonas aestuariivivens TaxID=1938339 RepID=A0A3D8M3B2_9ALTE|nr:peptidoglycan-binding protein [Alteromonas aestuariivivens]RDV24106.1 peptidoglycan-binding protein [Alteromonas aestuariivivens]
MIPLDGDFILAVAPRFSGQKADDQFRIVSAVAGEFQQILHQYNIDSALRIAHFMGQVTHECAGFRTTEEFASGAAYENRADLGNTQKGDGKKYKGRGLIQLTGRFNYRKFGDLLGLPLEDKPEIAAEPLISLKIACEFWQHRKINAQADRDDLIAVTKLVNGGTNGLADRRKYLQRAKTELARIEGIQVAAAQRATLPVLRRGSFGDAVTRLQTLLVAKGFNLAIDSDFGAATELAVRLFQKQHNLKADGIVGMKTWSELDR